MLNSQITAKLYPQIGLLGQTVGFTDFVDSNSKMSKELNYIQSTNRELHIQRGSLFNGVLNASTGKVNVVNQTQIDADLYIGSVFDTINKQVESKIYITNVVFYHKSKPLVNDIGSPYCEREDMIRVDYIVKTNVI